MRKVIAGIGLVGFLAFCGAGPAAGSSSSADSTPPAAVRLFATMGTASGQVHLGWIAPGDDGNAGTAASYLLKYSLSPITEANWSAATRAWSVPAPSAAGTWQSASISGLTPGSRYYFALKALDDGGNLSPLSNAPSAIAGITGTVFVPSSASQPFQATNTERVVLGDLDGDGDLDLVEGNGGELVQPSIVYLNDGHGGFSPNGQTFPAMSLRDLALADVDGDGDLDVATCGVEAGATIWLNAGNGEYTLGQAHAPHLGARAVKLADVDGDGDLDLLLGTVGTRVFLNDGHGSFADTGQDLGIRLTRALAAGDVDADGDIDFVQGNVLYSAGGLSLPDRARGDTDTLQGNVIFADPPMDNRVYLNDGSGRFIDSGQALGSSTSCDVRLGDMDADGDLDLIVGNSRNSVDEIYANDGQGRFILSFTFGEVGNETKGLALGDVDNDGDLDVAAADWNGGNRLYANLGPGRLFTPGNAFGLDRTVFIALGDVDGDKDLDMLSAVKGSPNTLFVNNAQGCCAIASPQPSSSLQAAPVGTTVVLSWNAGEDQETPGILLTYNLRVGRTPGSNDVISGAIPAGPGNTGQALRRVLKNLPPGRYFWSVQTVDGSFARSAWAGEQSFEVGQSATYLPVIVHPPRWLFQPAGSFGHYRVPSIYPADLDLDGDIDLVVASEENDSIIQVYENRGNGVFRNSGTVFPFRSPDSRHWNFGITVADLDEDGLPDLATADAWAGLNVYLNRGQLRFVWSQNYVFPGMGEVKGIASADLNRDGHVDIILGDHNGESRGDRILFNDGSGHLVDSNQSVNWDVTWDVSAIDLNRDGAVDYVSVNRYAEEPTRFNFNNGSGVFDRTLSLPDGLDDSMDVKCFAYGEYTYCFIANSQGFDARTRAGLGRRNRGLVFDRTGALILDNKFGRIDAETKDMCIADLNADGYPDLIEGNYNGESNAYFGRPAAGGRLVFDEVVPLFELHTTAAIGCGDFNGDGALDLVVGINGESTPAAYRLLLQAPH